MKDLQKLAGAKILSKKEQQTVKGGKLGCDTNNPCPDGYKCIGGTCEREVF
ncbi:hypothetical protein [Labilibaculum euxinus]|uniref:Bacteriocin n=1 Tax=Labilibaculum euxinus TaxID=2686357 RepID=A0A7M4DAN9_9BACT|nr:hypothetical protein [Labilibaculum euxinus]MUP39718.1 hypothetical protein [Labilibaculum euxinus]MVB08923.1 hypothetical protein [Labilibaculum euxinus]